MADALNKMRASKQMAPLPYSMLVPHVSGGTPALLRLGFDVTPEADSYEALRLTFLEIYERNICNKTTLYPGIDHLIRFCYATNVFWGIVTNKPERLTKLILDQLQVVPTIEVIGGDTLPVRKPHPRPITHACDLAGVEPVEAVYIGDSIRDIEAGRAAGVATIAVTYGYIPPGDNPYQWGADVVVDSVDELYGHLWEHDSVAYVP